MENKIEREEDISIKGNITPCPDYDNICQVARPNGTAKSDVKK